MWSYMSYDELYHHGIKGQKWGVRRYQNEDGSLTAEGVKRYSRESDELSSIYKKGSVSGEKSRMSKRNATRMQQLANRYEKASSKLSERSQKEADFRQQHSKSKLVSYKPDNYSVKLHKLETKWDSKESEDAYKKMTAITSRGRLAMNASITHQTINTVKRMPKKERAAAVSFINNRFGLGLGDD